MTLAPVRFAIVGCGNTLIDFALLNVLTLVLGLNVIASNSISVVIGICISYVLNHRFVFRYPEPLSLRRFLGFFAVTGFSSLVLQNLVIWAFELLFDTRFGHSLLFFGTDAGNQFLALNIAKAMAVAVGLLWNYAMYRLVVFRGSDRGSIRALDAAEPESTTR